MDHNRLLSLSLSHEVSWLQHCCYYNYCHYERVDSSSSLIDRPPLGAVVSRMHQASSTTILCLFIVVL